MTGRGIALLSLVVLVACGRPEREAAGPDHEGVRRDEASDERAAENELGVDAEMLRDLRITTAPVEIRRAGEGVAALGELGVNEEAHAAVGSPIPARVLRLLAAPGDTVTAGRPMAELQSVELGKARADYLSARARATVAAQVLARKRELAAERIVPRREAQEAEAAAAAAEAELRAARAALSALGLAADDADRGEGDSSRFLLKSPIAGTVIERDATPGEMADPARPLYRIADLSRLWLTVHAFERDAVRLQPGSAARVSFAALPGESFSGTVTYVGRRVNPNSRTVPVRIELVNDGRLRPGMSATAVLPLGDAAASVVAVPAAALQRLEQGWAVFIPRGTGTFEVRPVGRGRDLGGEVEILSGLTAGEQVVVEGAFLLKAEVEKSRGEGEHHDH